MDQAVAAMKPLLNQGVSLDIVSGTTNIAGGMIEKYFSEKELDNLFLGLGRGAYNYAFRDGEPFLFHDMLPDAENLEKIHRICFEVHMELKKRYHFNTDIIFSRPNNCKIDLIPEAVRGEPCGAWDCRGIEEADGVSRGNRQKIWPGNEAYL